MEASTIIQERNNEIKAYLLGELPPSAEDEVELRLLTEPNYQEDFDITVDELIDQYVSGKFEGEQLDRFKKYFLCSPERQLKLQFALALKNHRNLRGRGTSDEMVPRAKRTTTWLPSTHYLAIAASILVVVGLGFFFWRVFLYEPPIERGLLALQAAYQERPIEARLSDFNYAPLPNQRGAEPKFDSLKHDLAGALLLGEANANPSAASHHALGQYYLYDRQVNKAVNEFNAALSLDPNNAKIHNDLGAALLEEGRRRLGSADGSSAKQLAESLPHFNRCLELDNNHLAALFNRALLYDYLGLLHEAEADWNRFLQLDSKSYWAEEARKNLSLIQQKIKNTSKTHDEIFREFQANYQRRNDYGNALLLTSYNNRTGNVIVKRLVDGFLNHDSNAQSDEANNDLEMLSYAARIIKERTGDPFVSEMSSFYGSSNRTKQGLASRGRSLMEQGHSGWGSIADHENLKLFVSAKQLFKAAGAIEDSLLADYWIAFSYYRQHESRKSLSLLESLISRSKRANYHQLLARCFYLLAAVHFNQNEHSKAIAFARQSLDIASATYDTVGIINAISSLVEYFRYLGDYRESLKYIELGLPLITTISMDSVQGSRHFGFEATAFAAAGFLDLAREFQKEALRFALNTGNSSVVSYNYAFLGMINGKLGNLEQALKDTELAYEVARERSGDQSHRELMAFATLQKGHIYRRSRDFGQAIASYGESIDRYEKLNHPTNLYQAYKGRFLSHVAQGHDTSAKADLKTTLNLAEQYRGNIFEQSLRETFFDSEQSFYDTAIDFAYSRSTDPKESFRLSELSHARSLLDLIHSDTEVLTRSVQPEIIMGSASFPLTPNQVLNEVSTKTQIVQYAIVEHKVIIWVISKGRIEAIASAIEEKDLTSRVRAYLKLASSQSAREDELTSHGKNLYEILVQPIESLLDSGNEICIVPDKILSYLPFASLISPSSGEYFLQKYRLLLSPSSTIFVASTRIAREKQQTVEEKLLSVGNPRFDRRAFPAFPDLPSAAEEAMQVAAFYKAPKYLIGEEARIETVKSEIALADVFHLAAHSSLDERFPLRSKLLLAGSDRQDGETEKADGALYAHEIYGLKLPRTRLAVLSGCETGAERYYGGEGMISLARPFIAARVPLVVASLWSVDSDLTRELMVSFQKFRKVHGYSTVDALRKAQLEMLSGLDVHRRRPYYWAPFVVIGGHAEF